MIRWAPLLDTCFGSSAADAASPLDTSNPLSCTLSLLAHLLCSPADYYWTKTMTLEERVFEVVRRYKLAMEGLERTTDALHRTARAMDKQQVEAENAVRLIE